MDDKSVTRSRPTAEIAWPPGYAPEIAWAPMGDDRLEIRVQKPGSHPVIETISLTDAEVPERLRAVLTELAEKCRAQVASERMAASRDDRLNRVKEAVNATFPRAEHRTNPPQLTRRIGRGT